MENLKRICVFFLFTYNGFLANGSDSLDCNFENGLCNWIQDRNDNFNWTRRLGPTPTNNTGPDSDHTYGEGYYVYIDTSEVGKNTSAKLISPLKNPGQYCLSFWCYMYGNDVGPLKVFIKKGRSSNRVLRISREIGRRWILIQININTTESFEIVIEGKVRNRNFHDLGDIAIDDITMFPTEECPADCGDPIPEFGLVYSPGNITIGSTARTSCEDGYTISGNPSMICQANGSWSERPVCHPLDCGAPNFDGDIIIRTLEGTTYNRTVMLECVEGFALIGNDFVTCQSDGSWTPKPTCIISNCSDPTPESGIVNDTNFQYGSAVEVTCIENYRITGHSSIICQANSTWSDRPRCDQIDLEANTLIAVYIVVPLIVVILIILLTVCIWRKRQANGNGAKHVTCTHPIIQYPNETYNEYDVQNHTGPPDTDESMSPDEDYAVIDHDRQGETSENVYYNTFDADCNKKDFEHQYDHTKNTSKAFTDKNYSHTTGNITDTKFKPNYDTIQRSDTYNEPIRSDAEGESESYDHIHIKNHTEIMKQEFSIKLHEEQESNYDHAIAGGIDPEVLEQDEYSHLNDANIIKRENNRDELSAPYEYQYSNVSESTEEHKRIEKERKAGYEEPVGQTPHYFILEKNQNESEEDKRKLVLETEKNGGENDGSCNHDYFVLKKIECLK